MTVSNSIIINGAFMGQAITGQQRFAHEISSRLSYPIIAPPMRLGSSKLGAWAWASSLSIHPYVRRSQGLLTLTSRGPFWCRNQYLVVHDLFVLKHPEWYSKKYVATHAPILRAQIQSAKGIFAVSEPVMEEIKNEFNIQVPTAVVPNAPAEIFLNQKNDSKNISKDILLLIEKPFILSVASLDPRKNIKNLVSAYMSLDKRWRVNHPLILCGGGNNSVFANDNNTLEDETIIRLGYVSDEILAILYRNAYKVVFTPLDEGFGLPAVEALASGAKLIVSDIPVLRWVCGDSAVYVDPLNIDSISAGIQSESLAQASFDKTKFSWEQSASIVQDYFAKHLSQTE